MTRILFAGNHVFESTKRRNDGDLLPLQKHRQKGLRKRQPFTIDYQRLCSEMMHLSSEDDPLTETKDEFSLLTSALAEVEVEKGGKEDYHDISSLQDMLELEWHSHISLSDKKSKLVSRAIVACDVCGIKTFRDVLWYNNSLAQAASLKMLPFCLIDMAYELSAWEPRKQRPFASRQAWLAAWETLFLAWPLVTERMWPDLRTNLLKRKYVTAPSGANWFEFNYFDGILEYKVPLLCYVDSNDEEDLSAARLEYGSGDRPEVFQVVAGAPSDEESSQHL